MKGTLIMLLISVALTGLSAGIGFANVVGYIPAIKETPAHHLLSFWQHADYYFKKRMPIFGNALLLSLLATAILLAKDWKSLAFWLIVFALLGGIGEMVVIVTKNLPLNKIIVTLDPEKPSTASFEPMRSQAVRAYYTRAVLNFVVFGCTLAAAAFYVKGKINW